MKRLAAAIVALAIVAVPTAAHADAIRDREYWLDDYGIREAWSVTRGEGVTIAIIDTGVDSSVPELRAAVTGGADFSSLGAANGQRPVGDDESEHATMVASLAAGRGTSTTGGVIGAAPAASILSLSIGFGSAAGDSDAQIADAVEWAVDNGADIINMSLTRNTVDWPERWDEAFLYAAKHDVIVVAAAGNRGSGTVQVGAPATMPGVVAVGGLDRAGNSSFNASAQGISIAVTAPSEQLVGALPGGGHTVWNGTSGATPIVAGVLALIKAAHPDLDAANVINRLVATARDRGAAGVDPIYGFGAMDAAAAVLADVPRVDANPLGDLAEWVTIHRESTAQQTPVAIAEESPAPAAPAPVANPIGTLLPSVGQLRDVGLPLALFGAVVALFAAVGVRAARDFRRIRRRE